MSNFHTVLIGCRRPISPIALFVYAFYLQLHAFMLFIHIGNDALVHAKSEMPTFPPFPNEKKCEHWKREG